MAATLTPACVASIGGRGEAGGEIEPQHLAVNGRRAFDQRGVEAGIVGLRAAVAHRDEQLVVVAVRAEVDLVDRVEDVVEVLILQQASLQRGRAGDDLVLVEGVRAVVVGRDVEQAVGLVVGVEGHPEQAAVGGDRSGDVEKGA